MIEIENRTRSVYRFPRYVHGKRRPGSASLAIRHDETLVIGDCEDRDRTDSLATPSPVVRLSQDEFDGLGSHNKSAIEALVAAGSFQLREVAA